jgi:ABC-type transport system involved in cytochrome bd biosynthesis fused ATPase/permease subunit
MNTLRSLLFRTLVPVSFATICVYLTYAKEGPALVPIARNLAWNDFITQIKFLPQDSPQDSIDKEMLVIQRFLKEHETETNVGVYDLAVFRAIDQVRARLHKADKDLETLRNGLSYKEEQARLAR